MRYCFLSKSVPQPPQGWNGNRKWLVAPPPARHRHLAGIGCLAALLLLALLTSSASAARIIVATASNFAPTLKVIAENYHKASGNEVVIVSGATGKHYAQIRNGAPFDLFLAADSRRPQLLEQNGQAEPGDRFTYAIGRLVLWSPEPGRIDSGGTLLGDGTLQRIAIANPRHAPYGQAARQVLQELGLWHSLEGRLVRGENVAQTFQFVHSGNADAGFIAWSQLQLQQPAPQGSWWLVPEELYPPIEQQAVLLNRQSEATDFFNFIRSEPARLIIRSHGYATP